MEKKIGCVIAYTKNHNNYGTALVGYALIKTIQKLGYNCEIIRYEKSLSPLDKLHLVYNMFRVKEKSKIRGLKNKFYKKRYKVYRDGIAERTIAVNKYKSEKLDPLFEHYKGFENLKKGSLNYDAVVVGSDQVWTPMSLYSKFFNLLFVNESVPKIAYASSFGVSQIPNFQREETKSYLERFYKIGVREIKGKEIVESISTAEATVVADPTLLLDKDEWLEEISTSVIDYEKDSYIFCYLLGTNQETRNAINDLKKKTGLKVVVIRHMDEFVKNDESFGDDAPYNVSPNDFLKLIANAKYVCTDSFHCTIFSVHFERKFITFYRFNSKSKNSRNSRIDSLFSILQLGDRLYQGGDLSLQISKDIDFFRVQERVARLRKESLDFLQESLDVVSR
ncbi:MAG TPA: polysaccharide pyruvyl transferase family protein [Sphingobacterium sp.]|nr:polysaccharide pyruvyl transferase family protein [Sphingobacterium sp.]